MKLVTGCRVIECCRRKQEGFMCLISEIVYVNPSRVRGNLTINKKRICRVVLQVRLLVNNFVYGKGSQ